MAIAGKVSIVPRGEWQSTEVYTRLDLVTFNRNAYLSLKESTGVEPTNEEYWMLLIENVANTEIESLQTQIDDIVEDIADIINGTTPVAKAEDSLKLNGLTADQFVSNGNMLINTDFSNPVNSSGKTEWMSNNLCIDAWLVESNVLLGGIARLTSKGIQLCINSDIADSSYASIFTSIYKLNRNKEYTLSFSVDDIVYRHSFESDTPLPNGISIGKVTIYYLHDVEHNVDSIYIRNFNKEPIIINWVKLEPGSIATPYIPPNKEVEKLKCGATVGDAESVNGFKVFTDISQLGIASYYIPDIVQAMPANSMFKSPISENDGTFGSDIANNLMPSTYGIIEINKITNNRTLVLFTEMTSKIKSSTWYCNLDETNWVINGWKHIGDGGNAATLDGYYASEFMSFNDVYGVTESYDFVDSSGNIGIGYTTFPDGTKAMLKIYKDSHAVLSFHNGENWNENTILHTGISRPTVVSSTAPSNKSALWYDTTNKVCKYYKDGAWTQ